MSPGTGGDMETTAEKVNLRQKLGLLQEPWSPRLVGRVNDVDVKLAKLAGEFVWHHHPVEDELFLVLSGRLLLQLRDRDVWLEEGEMFIVPRGVEHRPVAEEEAHVLLVEPRSTLNTGNVVNERTVREVRPI